MKGEGNSASVSAFALFSKNKISKKKKKKLFLNGCGKKARAEIAKKKFAFDSPSAINTSVRSSVSESQQSVPDLVPSTSSAPEIRRRPKPRASSTPKVQVDLSDKDSSTTSNNLEPENTFEWLIHPLNRQQFFDEIWEKKACAVKRKNLNYYKGLFSTKDLDKILREKPLEFSTDIDVTSYENGVRKTHNGDGRAYAAVVWDHYQTGCSVRLLKPQTYNRSVWKLNAILQEYFGSFVGGNVYLTPPGSQGFAPHYDDIEAFVLQLEGKKHWKVYQPRDKSLELPRFSSGNFSNTDDLGELCIDITLLPGDLLYFPRGYIHQAKTDEAEHSLHLTLSASQRNTWGDLLEKLIPRALQMAFEEDIEYRQSLPRDYMSYMGVANCDKDCPEREAFLKHVKVLTERLSRYLATDAASDQMAKIFIHNALPPVLTNRDRECSIHGNGEYWDGSAVRNAVELDFDSCIKVIRQSIIRIVMEEGCVRLYHSMENTRVYQEVEPQYIEIGVKMVPAIEFLLHTYPEYVAIKDLPLESMEAKMDVASLLYDKGLLVTENPLTEPEES